MTDIEETFQRAIDSGKINGVVLCASNSKKDFTYMKALGHRNLLSGQKVKQQLDDVLYLASATKIMTSLAVMTCIEDELFSLDGDLSHIAPELAAKKVLRGFSDENEPVLEPLDRSITMEMLMTHTSGLVYDEMDPLLVKWQEKFSKEEKYEKKEEKKFLVEEFFDYPLVFQPGSSWMYGPGLDWAGRIVERVTGVTLTRYLSDRVFRNMNIRDFSFYPVIREDLRARLVDLNFEDPQATGRAMRGGGGDKVNTTTKGDFGGHGLFMTGADFIKILHSLLADDERILKSKTLEILLRNRVKDDTAEGFNSAKDFFGFLGIDENVKIGFGLGGVVTQQDSPEYYGAGTMTWGGTQTLVWFLDRKNGMCGIVAVQTALPIDRKLVGDLKRNFIEGIYHERFVRNL